MGPQNPAVASLYDTVRDCFTDNELLAAGVQIAGIETG
jgi:hypothetical protein